MWVTGKELKVPNYLSLEKLGPILLLYQDSNAFKKTNTSLVTCLKPTHLGT